MNMTLNRLPSITWRWLKMNEGRLEGVSLVAEQKVEAEVPAGVTQQAVKAEDREVPATGMGEDVTRLLTDSEIPVQTFDTQEGQEGDKPLRLTLSFAEGERTGAVISVKVRKGARLTVVEDFRSEGEDEAFGTVQTRYQVEEGAVLSLVQIQRLGDRVTFLNDLGGRVDAGGTFDVIHLILEGGKTYLGVRTDLAGTGARLKSEIGYRALGRDHLDINYIANHIGRQTTCDINAQGVLRDWAGKVFRGTIDLKKGSSGSVGNEKEDVLMMDDTVVNQTLPVILCTEEDVVGNHGATIGRLDEGTLFYLQSRGMDREAVYEMMADAKVASVVHQIQDQALRAELEAYLNPSLAEDLEGPTE